MKLLVTILTDKNIDLLHRAICSVFYQFKSGFKVCVYVVVNTLNDLYYEQVCNKYADNNNLQIYRTESNGLPGKGHNSCLELFKNMPECEYFTMLDGDDMYYPCAFQRFEQYIKRDEFDLLHVMTNDRIKFNNAKNYANKKLSHNFLLVSCFNNNEDFWKTISVRNPFTTPINKCATPTRIILMKRSALNAKIRYGEKLRVFDDMVAFCTLLDAHYSNKLNAKAISDTYIYLYNLINPQSVSFKNIDNHSEDKNFKEEMKNIKNRKWELDKLPFLELEPPDNFTT